MAYADYARIENAVIFIVKKRRFSRIRVIERETRERERERNFGKRLIAFVQFT